MRLLALMFAAIAVAVWWVPLDRFTQSVAMIFTAVMCLVIRRAVFLPKGAVEVKPPGPNFAPSTWTGTPPPDFDPQTRSEP